MKINKHTKVFLLAIFLLAIMSFSVSAALTLNSPASSTSIGGSTVFNVTVPESDSGAANFTCLLYAKSSLTANSTWTLMATASNMTAGGGGANYTNVSFASAVIEDANNYQFNATCVNKTGTFADKVNTGITVDNTKPTTPTCTPSGTQKNNTLSILCSVVGREVTSCVLYFLGVNPGQVSYTMTHSGEVCSYSLSSVSEQSYQYYSRASDETNTTDSSTYIETIDVKTSAGKATQMIAEGEATSKGGALLSITEGGIGSVSPWVWVVLIVVVFIVIFVIAKRRR